MPALSRAKAKGQSAGCLSNLRQLQLAWQLYADDHQDAICPNKWTWVGAQSGSSPGSWILGNAQYDPDPTNLTAGLLYPYAPALGVHRCPADKSQTKTTPPKPRLRRYMLDWLLNGGMLGYTPTGPLAQRTKLKRAHPSEPARPGSSAFWMWPDTRFPAAVSWSFSRGTPKRRTNGTTFRQTGMG